MAFPRRHRGRHREDAFDEREYLDANPDVAAAVATGTIASGAQHYELHGRREGRPLVRPPSRDEIVRSHINPLGRGLELGPLDRPIMPKREGYRVEVVDYLDAASLRAKYGTDEHPAIDASRIEEVDFVARGESLCELVGGECRYDWVVASHVIEHVPDVVSFLQDVERLLRPDGRLALVVPDARYTFDHYGELSTTGQLLDAYAERRRRPTPGQAFDHYARAALLNGANAWSADTAGVPELMHPHTAARAAYERALDGDDFDGELHCWRFTPTSLGLVIDDLAELGLIGLAVEAAHDTLGCEFFVTLAKVTRAPTTTRIDALRGMRRTDAPLTLRYE